MLFFASLVILMISFFMACKKYDLVQANNAFIPLIKSTNGLAFHSQQKIIYLREESPISSSVQKEYPDFQSLQASVPLPTSTLQQPYTRLQRVKIELKEMKLHKTGLLEETIENITQREQNPTEVFNDVPTNLKEKITKSVRTNNNTIYYNPAGEIVRTHSSTSNTDFKNFIDTAHYYLKNKKALGKQRMQQLKTQGYEIKKVNATEGETHHNIKPINPKFITYSGGRTSEEPFLYKATLDLPETHTKKIAYFYPDEALSEKQAIFYVDDKIDYLVDFYYKVKADSTLQLSVTESVMPQLRENGFNSLIKHTEIIEADDTQVFE